MILSKCIVVAISVVMFELIFRTFWHFYWIILNEPYDVSDRAFTYDWQESRVVMVLLLVELFWSSKFQGSSYGWCDDFALWAFLWRWWNSARHWNGESSIEASILIWFLSCVIPNKEVYQQVLGNLLITSCVNFDARNGTSESLPHLFAVSIWRLNTAESL